MKSLFATHGAASPIYLLGAYRLGVRNTGVAYSTFDVRPQVGGLKAISGKVPVPGRRGFRKRKRTGDSGLVGHCRRNALGSG